MSDLLTAIAPALTLLEIPIGTTSIGSSATSISAGFTGVFTNFRGFAINADRDFYAGKGPFTGYGAGRRQPAELVLQRPRQRRRTVGRGTGIRKRRLGPGKHSRPAVGAVGVDGRRARNPPGRLHAADHQRRRGRP